MSLKKEAGDFRIDVRAEGWPIWTEIAWKDEPRGLKIFHGLRLEDLKDLQYCLTSAIAFVQGLEDADRARDLARKIRA